MEKITLDNLEKYISLQNQLAFEDPYVIKINREDFIKKHSLALSTGKSNIFLLNQEAHTIGFVEVSKGEKELWIEDLYVKKEYQDTSSYIKILDFIEKNLVNPFTLKVRYTGVNNNAPLLNALKDKNYLMEKEHIQMEKVLSKTSNKGAVLPFKSFYDFGDSNKIYTFMKECMVDGIFNYQIEEIHQLVKVKSDLTFLLYEDKQPIGFMISHINEKRNQQENKNVLYIEELAILKDYRNKGYGYNMIDFILNKEHGMDIARLHVYRHNQVAYKLYNQFGFSEVKSIGYWLKDV